MFARFAYVLVYGSTALWLNITPLYDYHILFILTSVYISCLSLCQSTSVDGLFVLWAVMDNTVRNIHVQVFMWTYISISFLYRSKIVGSNNFNSIFIFLRNPAAFKFWGAVLGFEFRASCLLNRHSTTWAMPSAAFSASWMDSFKAQEFKILMRFNLFFLLVVL
jgi:hypothetical protein